MKPGLDKAKKRKLTRAEFEHSSAATQAGRSARRKFQPRSWADTAASFGTAASHGEDLTVERDKPLPREDRAG